MNLFVLVIVTAVFLAVVPAGLWLYLRPRSDASSHRELNEPEARDPFGDPS